MTEVDHEPTPVEHALAQLSTVLDHVVKLVDDDGLGQLDDARLVGFLQGFETVRNRLPLVDHRSIGEVERRQLPDRLAQPHVRRFLVQALRLSPAEASRRVRAAAAVGERLSPLGQPLPPLRPALAAAQRAGRVSAEQVNVIDRALTTVDRPGFDPADIAHAEQVLTGYAETFGPQDLQRLAGRVVDAIDPDGTRPDDQLNTDRRHLSLRPTADGAFVGDFRLTGPTGAKLVALLTPLARPRLTRIVLGDGRTVDEPDPRHHGQRMHDALDEACDRLLRTPADADTTGIPATVIVTIDERTLRTGTGHGASSDGTPLTTEQILRLAGQAEVIPTVLTAAGAVLSLGRTRRIASRSQTLALVARDGGCSFPSCDRPPEWCERHHIREWCRGGPTDLDNLTLLCSYHHHNFAARGWTCRLNADRLPEWQPPTWVDRARRPLLNPRIDRSALLAAGP